MLHVIIVTILSIFVLIIVYGSAMIGNHGYQVILDSILKNPELKINITEAYVAMKEEVNIGLLD